MKRVLLFLIGFVTLLLGYLVLLIMNYYDSKPEASSPLLLINIAALIIWGLVGKLSIKLVDKKIEAILILSAPAFITLLLLLYQEIIMGQYWPNIVGGWTQLFWLPFIGFTFPIAGLHNSISFSYIAAFLLLFIASYIGRTVGEKRKY